jgi:hypothetical protein
MYVPSLGIYIPKLGIKLSPQIKDFLTTVQEQYQCSLTINVEQPLLPRRHADYADATDSHRL